MPGVGSKIVNGFHCSLEFYSMRDSKQGEQPRGAWSGLEQLAKNAYSVPVITNHLHGLIINKYVKFQFVLCVFTELILDITISPSRGRKR